MRGAARRPRRAGQQCRHRRADRAIEDIDPADWRRCIDIDLTGQFLCARRAVPMLKAAGGGAIVNMSSAAGRLGYAFRTPYAAAKWGVIGLTQSLAKELGPHNITRQRDPARHRRRARASSGVIGARAEQLGLTYAEMERQYLEKVSLRRMVTAAGGRGHGAVPGLAARAAASRASRWASAAMSRRCEGHGDRRTRRHRRHAA